MKRAALIVALLAFFIAACERAADYEEARADTVTVEQKVQGKGVVWWSKRAIQNGKNARARGRTIRRLQHAQIRSSAHFFNWLAAADCVHRHESIRWDLDGATYDGGMQADHAFQRAYAPDLIARYGGWAHTWPWYAQLQMAYRGWLFRGWQPWPLTSRMCGLR